MDRRTRRRTWFHRAEYRRRLGNVQIVNNSTTSAVVPLVEQPVQESDTSSSSSVGTVTPPATPYESSAVPSTIQATVPRWDSLPTQQFQTQVNRISDPIPDVSTVQQSHNIINNNNNNNNNNDDSSIYDWRRSDSSSDGFSACNSIYSSNDNCSCDTEYHNYDTVNVIYSSNSSIFSSDDNSDGNDYYDADY